MQYLWNRFYMIRFRDKPKGKVANANTPAKDVAPEPVLNKETESVAAPLPNTDAAKNEDVKQ